MYAHTHTQVKTQTHRHTYMHTHMHTYTHAHLYLYEAELPPAECIADRGKGGNSQQNVQCESQNPNGIVGISTPGGGRIEHRCPVLPDLTERKRW